MHRSTFNLEIAPPKCQISESEVCHDVLIIISKYRPFISPKSNKISKMRNVCSDLPELLSNGEKELHLSKLIRLLPHGQKEGALPGQQKVGWLREQTV